MLTVRPTFNMYIFNRIFAGFDFIAVVVSIATVVVFEILDVRSSSVLGLAVTAEWCEGRQTTHSEL